MGGGYNEINSGLRILDGGGGVAVKAAGMLGGVVQ